MASAMQCSSIMMRYTDEHILDYMLEHDDDLSAFSESGFENAMNATDVSSGKKIAAISDKTNEFTRTTS